MKKSEEYLELLWDLGRREYFDLKDTEVQKLTGLLIKEYDPKFRHEFIVESIFFDEFINLYSAYLVSTDQFNIEAMTDNAFASLKMLTIGVTKYAKNMIIEMLEQMKVDKQIVKE